MKRLLSLLLFLPGSLLSCWVALVLVAAPSWCSAQEMRGVAVQGYVTAVRLPEGIDVNGRPVVLQPDTSYGLQKDKTTEINSPLKSELKPGLYVWVSGRSEHDVTVASAVRFREDWNQKLEGFGPINKAVSAGSEPVFLADGYPIRISSATTKSFHGEVQSLDGVGANVWLHYKAKRGTDRVLMASVADFVSVKPKGVKVVNGVEDYKLHFESPDMTSQKNGRVMLGVVGTWYTIPADRVLQDRVARIGQSLVPSLQRALPDGDPGKIKFLFYAVDDPKLHEIMCSPRGGVILIPKHLLARLQNDNQVAAALGYAIGATLQRQGMNKLMEQGKIMREELGTVGIYLISPLGLAVALDFAGALPDHQVATFLEEQRGRLALSLMSDAGYDPWQAPEAVRLLASKNLPKDLASLKYPDLAGYLLGVLNLQYPKTQVQGTVPGSGNSAQ